ncbi:TIGR02391 family protein [Kitasatospora sp. NPDC096140]|uniref:TIGR02391 family protein n=1 Tax=Kitasatospora sp. NPDC096140 TaxID=3155425 RepID=UPI003327377F
MRIMAPDGLPCPEGDEGYELLETVWDWFSEDGEWPTFDDVERALYRKGIDAEKAIQQLPPDLVWGIDAGMHIAPQDHQQVQLTAAGLANCAEAGLALKGMLLLLQLAVEIERAWVPGPDSSPGARPTIDYETFVAGRDPRTIDRRQLALAAYAAVSEPWSSGLARGDGLEGWELSFGKKVRKYVGLGPDDLRGYWKLRQQLIGRPEAVTVEEAISPKAAQPEPAPIPDLAFTCVLHSEITAVAARRIENGEYADAVLAAYRAVEHRVQKLTGLTSNGHQLMGDALSPPKVRITVTRSTDANLVSEQRGMAAIFSGVMQALRNTRAHGPDESDEFAEAAETLVLASWLMRRLDLAEAALGVAVEIATTAGD